MKEYIGELEHLLKNEQKKFACNVVYLRKNSLGKKKLLFLSR